MAERRRVARFASLLDTADDSAAHDLAPLLILARTLQQLPTNGDIEPEFRRRLRTRLVAMSTVSLPTHPGSGEPAAPPAAPQRRRLNRRAAALGGALACVICVPAVGAASMNAVSGDRLYGIKRATESVQVRLAGGDADRGRRHLALARTRLAEAREVRSDERALLDTMTAMDRTTVQGAQLLTEVAAAKQDRAPLDSIDEFVTVQSPDLGSLVQSLPAGAARERAVASLVLVERLRARSGALRATLVCPASAAGTDDLGPTPISCAGAGNVPGAVVPGGGGSANSPGTGLGGSPGPVTGGIGGIPGSTPGLPGTGGTSPGVPPAAAGAAGAVSGVVDDIVGSLGGTLGGAPSVPGQVPLPVPGQLPLPLPLPVPVPVPVPVLPVPFPTLPTLPLPLPLPSLSPLPTLPALPPVPVQVPVPMTLSIPGPTVPLPLLLPSPAPLPTSAAVPVPVPVPTAVPVPVPTAVPVPVPTPTLPPPSVPPLPTVPAVPPVPAPTLPLPPPPVTVPAVPPVPALPPPPRLRGTG